jgi:hypothetical protein
VFVFNFTCSIWFRPWCSYSVFITLQDQTYGGSQTTTKYSSTSIDAVVKGDLDQILILTIVSSCWYSTSSWRIEFHYSGMVNLVEMYHSHVFSPQSIKNWDWIVRMEIKFTLHICFGSCNNLDFYPEIVSLLMEMHLLCTLCTCSTRQTTRKDLRFQGWMFFCLTIDNDLLQHNF